MSKTHLGIHHILKQEEVYVSCSVNPGKSLSGDQPPFLSLSIGPFVLYTTAAKGKEIRDALDKALSSDGGRRLIEREKAKDDDTAEFATIAGPISPLPR